MVSVAHGSGLEAAHTVLSGSAAPMRATRMAGILLGIVSISTLPKGSITPCRTDRRTRDRHSSAALRRRSAAARRGTGAGDPRVACGPHRSEEHTSELQSLMRISYAVFCLKKKNNNTKQLQLHRTRFTQTRTNKLKC